MRKKICRNMKRFNWGINATGNIANSMASALTHIPEANLLAVSSRAQKNADKFAKRWSVPKAYANFESLVADTEIDIVYIATPNAAHKEQILLALAAGKHVLCEKPMTTSYADMLEVIGAAERSGKFLMEAMWTAFFPATQEALRLVRSGEIGNVVHVQANFISKRSPEAFPNLFDPTAGGGALLDLGVYPLAIANLFGGKFSSITAAKVMGKTAVDEMTSILAQHENGVLSQLSVGFRSDVPIVATISGEEGQIVIGPDFHCPEELTIRKGGCAMQTTLPRIGNGYPHEVLAVHDALNSGRSECAQFNLSASLEIMAMIDQLKDL